MTAISQSQIRGRPSSAPWRMAFWRLVRTLRAWRERASSRRDLSQMEDRLLKDIGVSRIEAMREAEKPFWVL